MYPQTIRRRNEAEYTQYCEDMKAQGVHPETSLYKYYVKSEIDAGRTPKPAVTWANDRAKHAFESETDEVKARVMSILGEYNKKNLDRVDPVSDDEYDGYTEELRNAMAREAEKERRKKLET